MTMVENELKTENQTRPIYRLIPRYSAWIDENKFVIQVALPGVSKDQLKMKALKDYFQLRALRVHDNVEFDLDLDLNFAIDPKKVTSSYTEGFLRVEFERYDPLSDAFTVPIN